MFKNTKWRIRLGKVLTRKCRQPVKVFGYSHSPLNRVHRRSEGRAMPWGGGGAQDIFYTTKILPAVSPLSYRWSGVSPWLAIL